MEIQFEQNRDFNQAHRNEPTVTDTKEGEKGKPQGREGNPNQRLTNREELETDEKELDRRPADVADENLNTGDDGSSAVQGIQSDAQNTTRNSGKPSGEEPNYNAEVENKEDKQ